MRINIAASDHRSWAARLTLKLVRWYIGVVPGPMLFLTHDRTRIPWPMWRYMLRGTAKNGLFSKPERELFASFVSKLNSCTF